MNWLDKATSEFSWPGLHILELHGQGADQRAVQAQLVHRRRHRAAVLGHAHRDRAARRPALALRVYGQTLNQIKWALVTVCAVLAVAYVMNFSGQTITLGTWAAGAGGFFAFLSPLIGWFGTAVTGSDTSTNSLFGALQVTAAKQAGLSPTLMAAANSSGGVIAKMVSPRTWPSARPRSAWPARRATSSAAWSAGAPCWS